MSGVVPSRGRGAAGGGLNGCGRVWRAIAQRIGRGISREPDHVRDRDAGGGAEPAVHFGEVTLGNGSASVGDCCGDTFGLLRRRPISTARRHLEWLHRQTPERHRRQRRRRTAPVWYATHRGTNLSRISEAELALVGDALQQIVDGQPDSLTGVSCCSPYEGVAIYGRSYSAATSAAIRSLADDHPAIPYSSIPSRTPGVIPWRPGRPSRAITARRRAI